MNKKLIAVAVAGALGAPGVALAQASTVQIYGTLVMSYAYVDSGGVGTGNAITTGRLKTDMIYTNDTNIGFKGEESLGGGLTGWFQCESTADLATGGGAWCGRNSAFGMKSAAFGNVWFGIWDTPMKIAMANYRPFSTASVFGMGGLMWAGSGNNVANGGAAASFSRRQNNLISYQTNQMGGLTLGVAYSAANEATAQTAATTAAKPRLFSTGITYANGPLVIGGGYETHRNYNTAAQAGYQGGTDRAYGLGVAYTLMGTLKLMAMYGNLKYELVGGTDMQLTNYSLHADWAFAGPHRVRAGFTRAGDTKGSAGTAAAPIAVANGGNVFVANGGQGQTSGTLAAIQYAYAFSKRTEVNFGYSRLSNSLQSRYVLQSSASVNTGQDQSAWNLGVRHTF